MQSRNRRIFPEISAAIRRIYAERPDVSISITVNGEVKTVETGQSVWSFLVGLKLDPKKVAVERNLEIVSKSLFKEVAIEEGDQLEIVHFIGGG